MSFLFLKQNQDANWGRESYFHAQFSVKKSVQIHKDVSMFCCEIEIKLSSSALRNGDGVNPLYASVG